VIFDQNFPFFFVFLDFFINFMFFYVFFHFLGVENRSLFGPKKSFFRENLRKNKTHLVWTFFRKKQQKRAFFVGIPPRFHVFWDPIIRELLSKVGFSLIFFNFFFSIFYTVIYVCAKKGTFWVFLSTFSDLVKFLSHFFDEIFFWWNSRFFRYFFQFLYF